VGGIAFQRQQHGSQVAWLIARHLLQQFGTHARVSTFTQQDLQSLAHGQAAFLGPRVGGEL
jgi:hypothetical protein